MCIFSYNLLLQPTEIMRKLVDEVWEGLDLLSR